MLRASTCHYWRRRTLVKQSNYSAPTIGIAHPSPKNLLFDTIAGYLLGGLCWFAIPFALATAVGLASVALDLPVTAAEAGAGLVPPATA
eukprot:7097990-Pyramimonas_sp.AAC.1